MRRWRPVSHSSALRKEIERRLGWTYPYISATRWPSKQAISDLQREMSDEYSAKPLIGQFRSAYAERPRFLEGDTLSPAERGTAMHAVMQHIRLDHPPNKRSIDELLRHMVNNEQLTPQQAQTVDSEQILAFFHSPLGQRLLAAAEVHRETPFSIGLPAGQIYSTAEDHLDETVLIQGVVDCVFREADGKLILVDYKTDAINDRFPEGFQQVEAVMRKRYGLQMSLCISAWQTIWREDIAEAYFYFFDGGYVLNMKQGADPFDQTGADEQQRLKEG